MHDEWGIDDGWYGVDGAWHPTADEVRAALRVAMGGEAESEHLPHHRPSWVVRPGGAEPLQGPCRLVLEDGTDLGTVEALPPDLPLGYHRLEPAGPGPITHLICSPGRCHLPADLRAWGITVQVPTARSRRSWGIGDLGDLAGLARWATGAGAGFLGLSPLHAPDPGPTPSDSPYYPSSRRWRSPLLIDVDAAPGATVAPEVAEAGRRARALLDEQILDRRAVWAAKRSALRAIWDAGPRTRDPEGRAAAWRGEQGDDLEAWATYAALVEVHGSGWRTWPAELRHPSGPGVARAATDLGDAVGFHAWLQWLIEDQLAAVQAEASPPGADRSSSVGLVHDLAVGCDPAGFDAWWWQDLLMEGCRVGAPPDALAAGGQDWGLPPFRPWALRDVGYQPLAQLVRSALGHGGGLRVDHVMGLARLYCIPPGHDAGDGTYVRHQGTDLLEVLALESHRAGSVVVGEDLGTVEPGFREVLADLGVLSTRLALFEDDPPEAWPAHAMAAITTHDLPTTAGLLTGADAAELERIGLPADETDVATLRARVHRLAGTEPGDPLEATVSGAHLRLAAGPAALVAATLEDLLGEDRRPNVPGTTDERPNWSIALPVAIDDLDAAVDTALVAGIGAARAGIDDAHRASPPAPPAD